jgi:hypothetical protein
MRRVIALLAAAVISLELAAELLGADLAWLPDLLTGWSLAGCGVIAARARPQSLAGPLLASSGLLWFTGNLAGSDVALLVGVGGDGEFLYRAPLILAILTAPEGRPTSSRQAAVVASVCLAAVIPAVAQSLPGAVVTAVLVVLAAVAWRAALAAAAAFSAVVVGGAAVAHVLEPDQAAVAVEAAYGAELVVTAGVAVLATVRVDRPPVALADKLAARSQKTIEAFRDAVAQAVGDPSLAVVVSRWRSGAGSAGGARGDAGRGRRGRRCGARASPRRPGRSGPSQRCGDRDVPAGRERAAPVRPTCAGRRARGLWPATSGGRPYEQRRWLERRVRTGLLARLEALDRRVAGSAQTPSSTRRRTSRRRSTNCARLPSGDTPASPRARSWSPRSRHSRHAPRVPRRVNAAALPVLPDAVRTALLSHAERRSPIALRRVPIQGRSGRAQATQGLPRWRPPADYPGPLPRSSTTAGTSSSSAVIYWNTIYGQLARDKLPARATLTTT